MNSPNLPYYSEALSIGTAWTEVSRQAYGLVVQAIRPPAGADSSNAKAFLEFRGGESTTNSSDEGDYSLRLKPGQGARWGYPAYKLFVRAFTDNCVAEVLWLTSPDASASQLTPNRLFIEVMDTEIIETRPYSAAVTIASATVVGGGGTAVADTGQLAAGDYEIEAVFTSNEAAVADEFQWRNAANAANNHAYRQVFDTTSGNMQARVHLPRVTVVANERFRVVSTAAIAQTHSALIYARRLS